MTLEAGPPPGCDPQPHFPCLRHFRVTPISKQALAMCPSPSCALTAVWPQRSHSTSLNLVPHLSEVDLTGLQLEWPLSRDRSDSPATQPWRRGELPLPPIPTLEGGLGFLLRT